MGPLAAHFADVGKLPGIEAGIGFGPVQKVGHVGSRQQAMGNRFQFRQLTGAGFAAAGRHHGRHVPVQHAGGFAERIDAPEAVFQFLVRGFRH